MLNYAFQIMSASAFASTLNIHSIALPHDTLTSYLFESKKKQTIPCEELMQLINSIQTAAKSISNVLRKYGACKRYKSRIPQAPFLSSSKFSKTCKELSNEIFTDMLLSSYSTCLLVSSNSKEAIEVEKSKQGKYIVCFNPLDESSSNLATGSSFVIYRKPPGGNSVCAKDALQPGKSLIAAGYIVYGNATTIVLSTGSGVLEFVLDLDIGEFVMTDCSLTIPKRGNTYCANEGYMYEWPYSVVEYVEAKKNFKTTDKPYDLRYMGSFVADVHRTLKNAGIVIQPSTKESPNGTRNLLHDCIPAAYIVTQAGGLATNGINPILDITPESLNQKSQIFLGSRYDVMDIANCWKKNMPEPELPNQQSTSKKE